MVIKELEKKKENIQDSINGNDNLPRKTLNTIYPNQLERLRKLLVDGGYILNIKENDFIYLFTGNSLIGSPKLKWEKSKKLVVNLLDKICINFSFTDANNCIESRSKKLDSNDRPKRDYDEITTIVNQLK